MDKAIQNIFEEEEEKESFSYEQFLPNERFRKLSIVIQCF